MGRVHIGIVAAASLLLGAGVAAWLCVLPDGTRHTLPRTDHAFVRLATALVGGLGLYAAVLVPVAVHALGRRWPFRACLGVSAVAALLSAGVAVGGAAGAGEPVRGSQQTLDAVGGLMLCIGLLVLYLLAGVGFLSWAAWRRAGPDAEPGAAADTGGRAG